MRLGELRALTEAMLVAARREDWEAMESLSRRRAEQMQDLALSGQDRPALIALQQANDELLEIVGAAHQRRASHLRELGRGRRARAGYEALENL